jgi:GH15 family glucan-1,4-alpha-glucosidase
MASPSPYPPIGDYALIGDCHTAALIARDGSIDWFCPGRFDAPAVFCRLLDAHKGGYLRAVPGGSFSSDRSYRGATNVLHTTLSSAEGRVRFTDLMPIHRRTAHRQGYDVGTSQRLLRLIEGLAGEVDLELCYKPTFDFARAATEISIVSGLGAVAHASSTYLTLACRGVALERGPDGEVRGRIRVRRGDRLWLVLTFAQDPDRAEEALAPVRCQEQLERTLQYWEHWAA